MLSHSTYHRTCAFFVIALVISVAVALQIKLFFMSAAVPDRTVAKQFSVHFVPATHQPSLSPTTSSPSASPSFYDYVNQLFFLNVSLAGHDIGNQVSANKRCADMVTDAVAVLYYRNQSLIDLSFQKNASVVFERDEYVAHSWYDFIQHGMVYDTKPIWIGDEHDNCNDWASSSSYGMTLSKKEIPCSNVAHVLCLYVVRL